MTSEEEKTEERGEVYKEKRRGPRTDPWGTPVEMREEEEVEPFKETELERPVR